MIDIFVRKVARARCVLKRNLEVTEVLREGVTAIHRSIKTILYIHRRHRARRLLFSWTLYCTSPEQPEPIQVDADR